MQKMLGYMRRAIAQYDLISDSDKIAVGVSGGKDSLVMLIGLKLLARFIGIDYEIVGLSLDPMFDSQETDYSAIEALCKEYDIEYRVIRTHIAEIVFDIRKEPNPCSLCARMRRGALHDAAKELGCNKLALGHNHDDVVETFFMNLFNEGRIDCFSPKSYLSRKDITVIRPLVLAPENEVARTAKRLGFPVIKSACPVDGHTNRETMRQFIISMGKEYKGFSDKIFGAMQRADISGWGTDKQN
ncbi:MAG: tRNA 2-thiocytidine biosynthesis TtcA family protein [Oscillospiraceae bacterium]|nr:tRNA 2-thiocytidine biosynthesis TtcA family protein [Oscillospiraceae bacterium]